MNILLILLYFFDGFLNSLPFVFFSVYFTLFLCRRKVILYVYKILSIMNKFKNYMKAASASLVLGLASGMNAFAQYQAIDGTQALSQAGNSMSSLIQSLARVVQIALALGALVTLIMVIYNVFKGEREAASKIAWWVVGLALGFTLVTVVVNLGVR